MPKISKICSISSLDLCLKDDTLYALSRAQLKLYNKITLLTNLMNSDQYLYNRTAQAILEYRLNNAVFLDNQIDVAISNYNGAQRNRYLNIVVTVQAFNEEDPLLAIPQSIYERFYQRILDIFNYIPNIFSSSVQIHPAAMDNYAAIEPVINVYDQLNINNNNEMIGHCIS